MVARSVHIREVLGSIPGRMRRMGVLLIPVPTVHPAEIGYRVSVRELWSRFPGVMDGPWSHSFSDGAHAWHRGTGGIIDAR